MNRPCNGCAVCPAEIRKGTVEPGLAKGLAKIPEASILVSIVLGIFQVS